MSPPVSSFIRHFYFFSLSLFLFYAMFLFDELGFSLVNILAVQGQEEHRRQQAEEEPQPQEYQRDTT
jgi:hypothetical protein